MPDAASTLTARFLQLCLRARFEPAALEAARDLAGQEGFDWGQVFEAARVQVVSPILHTVLQDEPGLPPHVRQALRSAYSYSRRRNRFLLDELALALPALATAGVPALVLNGAALLEPAFGDIGLRLLRDVDLLLKCDDQARAAGVLEPLGYAPANAALLDGGLIAYDSEVVLRKSDIVEVALALHARPLHLPGEAGAGFAAWMWSVSGSGRSVLSVSPEARFIYLCAHAALRHPGRLLWLHDAAEFMHRSSTVIDWDVVVERVRQFRLAVPVQTAGLRLVEGWGAPIPPAVLESLASQPAHGEAGGPWAAGWSGARGRDPGAGLPSPRQRLRQLTVRAFPPVEYMMRKYRIAHRALAPLYYPIQWLDSLLEGWRR